MLSACINNFTMPLLFLKHSILWWHRAHIFPCLYILSDAAKPDAGTETLHAYLLELEDDNNAMPDLEKLNYDMEIKLLAVGNKKWCLQFIDTTIFTCLNTEQIRPDRLKLLRTERCRFWGRDNTVRFSKSNIYFPVIKVVAITTKVHMLYSSATS